MAAGRHGGNRDHEYGRDRDSDQEILRRRDSHSVNKIDENERGRSREEDRDRDKDREADRNRERSRDYRSRVRLTDSRDKDQQLERDRNGSYYSGYPSSPARGYGDNRGQGSHASRDSEREPGELSSGSASEDGGGWVPDSGLGFRSERYPADEGEVHKPDRESSAPVPGLKRRKYSPIVWDLDEKPGSSPGLAAQSKNASGLGGSTVIDVSASEFSPTKLPPPPPLPPSLRQHTAAGLNLIGSASARIPTSPADSLAGKPPQSSGSKGSSAINQISPSDSGGRHSHWSGSKGATPPFIQQGYGDSVSPLSPELAAPLSGGNESDAKEEDIFPMQELQSTSSEDEREPGQLPDSPKLEDEEEALQPRYISASRWADEYNSPRDARSEDEGTKKRKKRSASMDSEEGKYSSERSEIKHGSGQSISPEAGECMGERSEGARGKSKSSEDDAGQGIGGVPGKDDVRRDEQYDLELNQRELMDLDDGNNSEGDSIGQPHESESHDEPKSSILPEIPLAQRMIDMLQGCRSVDEFERLNKIDEGTYGVVYRAKNKKTGEIVALKKIKMEKERDGFPMTSLREINVLLSFHHPSVVDVKEVVVGSNLDSIFMVMEYMEHDLKGLMETMKQPFSQSEVKCLMLQLFEGVKYLHDNWVLHRDLKTSNLLLNNCGELKICDFGLARQYGSPLKPYTQMVVTLWYRAPELLLGAKQYSTAIDMWSLGCIMAELLAKEPLFNGKSEIDQLDKIFRALGTPNEKIWPDFVNLQGVKCNFVKQPYNKLRDKFPPTSFSGRPTLSESGFDLLNRLLTYDPNKRITAEEALRHEWFKEVPLPKSKEFMPTYPARHDHDRRMRRIMRSPDPLEEQRRKELRQGELGAGGLFC